MYLLNTLSLDSYRNPSRTCLLPWFPYSPQNKSPNPYHGPKACWDISRPLTASALQPILPACSSPAQPHYLQFPKLARLFHASVPLLMWHPQPGVPFPLSLPAELSISPQSSVQVFPSPSFLTLSLRGRGVPLLLQSLLLMLCLPHPKPRFLDRRLFWCSESLVLGVVLTR